MAIFLLSDFNTVCNNGLCFYYNNNHRPTIIWPGDILGSLHLIPTHVMHTSNNSHKSVFSVELCSTITLAYKATIVLHNVHKYNIQGRRFEHRINPYNGQPDFYTMYTANTGERTGYFELNGVCYYQYAITLVFKVQSITFSMYVLSCISVVWFKLILELLCK